MNTLHDDLKRRLLYTPKGVVESLNTDCSTTAGRPTIGQWTRRCFRPPVAPSDCPWHRVQTPVAPWRNWRRCCGRCGGPVGRNCRGESRLTFPITIFDRDGAERTHLDEHDHVEQSSNSKQESDEDHNDAGCSGARYPLREHSKSTDEAAE